MSEEEFWAIVSEGRKRATGEREGFMERQLAATAQVLSESESESELAAFEEFLWGFVEAADRDDLRAELRHQGEGSSDDWFLYFRLWLVSMGRDAFYGVMDRPASLREHAAEAEELFFESFASVGQIARSSREEDGHVLEDEVL